MDRSQAQQMRAEIEAVVKPIISKYGMDYQPSRITFNADMFTFHIKGSRHVSLSTARSATDETLKHGLARPGTKAILCDRSGKVRPVIITESRRTKYCFYFVDTPNRPMIANFRMFNSLPE